jgi:RecA/RadA recombinase
VAKKPLLQEPAYIDDVIIDSPQGSIVRRSTGLYSLDLALAGGGSIGLPLRSVVEVYGNTHVGKSTLTYYLSGMVAERGTIDLCDLEGLDPVYLRNVLLNSSFRGHVKIMDSVEKGKPRHHADMVNEMASDFQTKDDTNVVILDSVGAFVPTAESEGDIGESFMGRRAFTIAQFSRRMISHLIAKEQDGVCFVVNHVHSVIGGQGHITAGGDTLKNMANTRIMLWNKQVIKAGEDTIGYWVGGKLEKLRFGGKGRGFQFILIPDFGISRPLSAMFDCFDLGLAERSTHVKVAGKSFGFISKLFEAAKNGHTDKFDPFFELLEEHHGTNVLANRTDGQGEESEDDAG